MDKILKAITFYCKLYLKKTEPVIIFAPGRVGSMALHKNLSELGIFVFKLEFLNIGNSGAARFAIKHVFKSQRPAKIITIMRDPVTMMISYFFSKAAAGHLKEAHTAWKEKDVLQLQQLFIKEVLTSYRLDSHLYWYERDFVRATNINVFDHAFDTFNKHAIINHPIYPTLMLRTEMDDTIKATQISNFLHIPIFTLTRENTRSEKPDKELYERFKETLTLPTELLDKIYTAKVCTHFFGPEEIQSLRKQWSAN